MTEGQEIEMDKSKIKGLTVMILTKTMCKWCGGLIRKQESTRQKRSSWDVGDIIIKEDYHEDCWCEAIEIQT